MPSIGEIWLLDVYPGLEDYIPNIVVLTEPHDGSPGFTGWDFRQLQGNWGSRYINAFYFDPIMLEKENKKATVRKLANSYREYMGLDKPKSRLRIIIESGDFLG